MWPVSKHTIQGVKRIGAPPQTPVPDGCGRRVVVVASLLGALCCTATAGAADRIVLRTTLLRNRTVQSVDVEGLHLDNQTTITWDEVERLTVAPSLQPQADKLLAALGTPLFRIRRRLQAGDYTDLRELAEKVQPYYQGRRGKLALMVSQARMWGALAEGAREHALLAHVDSYQNLRGQPKLAEQLPGRRRPKIHMATAMSDELAPIWFHSKAAAEIKDRLVQKVAAFPHPRPVGLYYYGASISIAAGDAATAQRMMQGIPDRGRGVHWRLMLYVQQELREGKPGDACTRLAAATGSLADEDRAIGWYWGGRAMLAKANSQQQGDEALLQLLRVPAVFGQQQAELSGAALHQCMSYLESHDQAGPSVKVRRELLDRYRFTYYGRLAANGASPEAAVDTEVDPFTADSDTATTQPPPPSPIP